MTPTNKWDSWIQDQHIRKMCFCIQGAVKIKTDSFLTQTKIIEYLRINSSKEVKIVHWKLQNTGEGEL